VAACSSRHTVARICLCVDQSTHGHGILLRDATAQPPLETREEVSPTEDVTQSHNLHLALARLEC
jgi:hypothetical protein